MVTGGTANKAKVFNTQEKLEMVTSHLMTGAEEFGWQLQAWAIFANHYHFIASSGDAEPNLKVFLSKMYTTTAIALNQLDGMPGRRVWYQYWDTPLTFEKSYLARLHYVHENPVRHGLVTRASDYPWCSAAWFEQHAPPAFVRTVRGFKIDRLNIRDDF